MLKPDFLHELPPDVQNHRAVLLLEYNGAGFSGSQYQARDGQGLPTVEKAVRDALSRLNVPASPVQFAGRTDAGVHARGQVGHFTVAAGALDNIPDLCRGLNAVLPASIRVQSVALTPDTGFHARRSAVLRWYRYTVLNTPQPSVWLPPDAIWTPHPLNAEVMNAAARALVGVQDCKTFQCPDTQNPHSVCHTHYSGVQRVGDFVIFDIVANRFLYKMVRNIMGILLQMGQGKMGSGKVSQDPADDVQTLLAARNRVALGSVIAKPEGLSLMGVAYPPPYQFFKEPVAALYNLMNVESKQDENLFRKAS